MPVYSGLRGRRLSILSPGCRGDTPGSPLWAMVPDIRWGTVDLPRQHAGHTLSGRNLSCQSQEERLGQSGGSRERSTSSRPSPEGPYPRPPDGKAREPLFWLPRDLESYSSPLTREQFPLTGHKGLGFPNAHGARCQDLEIKADIWGFLASLFKNSCSKLTGFSFM